MARNKVHKIGVEIEDVNGSFDRLIKESPKLAKRYLSTAVFVTAGRVHRHMENYAPLGPDDQGLAPGEHIKWDIEHRGKTGSLNARVGIFSSPEQATVALFNEYRPNKNRMFMRPAAQASEPTLLREAKEALMRVERALGGGFK